MAMARYRTWIGWGVVVLAGLSLVAVNPMGYDAHSLPKVLLIRLAVVALVSLWLAASFFEGSFKVKRTPLDVPVLLLLLAWVISTIFAANQRIAFYGDFKSYDGLLTLLVFTGLFYLATGFLNEEMTERLAIALIISSVPLAVYGIAQHFKIDFLTPGKAVAGQAVSTFGTSTIFGAYLSFALPFAVATFFSARSRRLAALLAVDVGLLAVALFLVLSKGAWISAILGLAALGISARRLIWQRKSKLAMVSAVVVVSFVGAILVSGGYAPAGRSLALTGLKESGSKRLATWGRALKISVERPVAGFGPDSVRLAYFQSKSIDRGAEGAPILLRGARSGLIQAWLTSGAFGLLALLVFAGYLVVVGYRVSADSLLNAAFWSGSAGILTSYLVFGDFSPTVAVLIWVSAAVLGRAASWSEIEIDAYRLRKVPPAVPIAIAAGILAITLATLYRPLAADALFERGLSYRESVYDLQSVNYLQRATLLNPGEKSYLLALGEAKRTMADARRDPDEAREAEQVLDQAFAMDRYDPNIHLNRGELFSSWGLRSDKSRLPKAIDSFKRALELDPWLSEARYELGMVYVNQKKLDDAIGVWTEAVRRDPKLDSVWYALGVAYEQNKELEKAEASYRKALESSKDETARTQISLKVEEIAGKLKAAPAKQ
ncbi:MAG: tetratricopeptide repeat protein [Actinobacteria bacterium]|nr:tetratricopeptide repeat protein [Actinomycetota bacterium]